MNGHKVAYKPLTMSPLEEEDEDADEDVGHVQLNVNSHQSSSSVGEKLFQQTNYCNRFNLRQLRTLLYVTAFLLLLIFIAQLSNRSQSAQPVKVNNVAPRALAQITALDDRPVITPPPRPPDIIKKDQPQQQQPPRYENYMRSIKKSSDSPLPATRVDYLDDFQAPHVGKTINPWWQVDRRGHHKQYITISNYIRAMKSFNYNTTVTLTTQATSEFLYHTLELCKRWDGPISVAVYASGVEKHISITLIKYMRHCLPAILSGCIRDKLTWHMVYDKDYGSDEDKFGLPKDNLDFVHYADFADRHSCPKFAGPEPSDLIQQFQQDLKQKHDLTPSQSYLRKMNLTYPINVLRNTARLAATTKFVLASDIELYPSLRLVPLFEKFISSHNVTQEYGVKAQRFVFTLPIFEVKSNSTPPKTKAELVKLMQTGDAIFFHKYVCDECQNFPNRMDWLKDPSEDYSELVIFHKTKRDRRKSSWEPIFIGTNEDPLYDDRLTWDGRRDKMGQMYEMCLQDYQLLIVGNAFLVHAPGIKHFDKEDYLARRQYLMANNAIYDEALELLRMKYSQSGNVEQC